MSNFVEQDFSRLYGEKDFANEALLFRTTDLLICAVNLFLKEPSKRDDIIYSITYAIDNHLNSKDKIRAIHDINKEIYRVTILKRHILSNKGKIEEFIKVLDDILQWIEDKEEGKIQERADILKEIHPKKKNITRKGFQTILTDDKIRIQYNALKGKFIDKSTLLSNYKAVFRSSPLPNDFKEVKWILLNREGNPHKTAFREFLTLALGKAPDQKTINNCFTDEQGSIIQLANPKRIEFSNYYKDLEELFKD